MGFLLCMAKFLRIFIFYDYLYFWSILHLTKNLHQPQDQTWIYIYMCVCVCVCVCVCPLVACSNKVLIVGSSATDN